jgi:hypothetical protein
MRDPLLPVDPLTGRPLPEPIEVDRGPDVEVAPVPALAVDPREVWCPWCDADPGQPCTSRLSDEPVDYLHTSRRHRADPGRVTS